MLFNKIYGTCKFVRYSVVCTLSVVVQFSKIFQVDAVVDGRYTLNQIHHTIITFLTFAKGQNIVSPNKDFTAHGSSPSPRPFSLEMRQVHLLQTKAYNVLILNSGKL